MEKNVAWTAGHPGDETVPHHTPPKKTTVATVDTRRDRRRMDRRTARRSSSRGLGRHGAPASSGRELTSGSLQDGDVHGLAEPLLLDRVQGPGLLDVRQRPVHAVDQRVALLEEHPELLRAAGLLLELADDRGGRDLDRGDVEGGR